MALYGAIYGLPADAAVKPDPVTTLTTVAPCQDVMFVGVRGSGETPASGQFGMGGESTLAWQQFRNEIPGQSAAAMSIDYPSAQVTTLASPYSSGDFFRSIDTGVTKLEGVLAERSAACPTERYVLSGKSQGAIVVHRAVADMAAHQDAYGPHLMDRIDGVIVIADPDRVPNEDGSSYGTSASGTEHYGISYEAPWVAGNRYRPTTLPISASWDHPERWQSVCNTGDAVCDFAVASSGPGQMLAGFDVHTYSYVNDPSAIRQAASAVAAESRSRMASTEKTSQSAL
ncbi:Cutinase [Raineyella antarctica]|uniref:Cutinase n=1 Tax=Raineyella antarctica TaxID=1577474 RepID=A0A1G6GDS4_9ACTN|nr:cutinase family protein [Raineyella antarctica]SDB80137.1 Cutinase [Raineyella antarctica]